LTKARAKGSRRTWMGEEAWVGLLAPVSCYENLMKPTMWWSSRPCDHMWTTWRIHEDWKARSKT